MDEKRKKLLFVLYILMIIAGIGLIFFDGLGLIVIILGIVGIIFLNRDTSQKLKYATECVGDACKQTAEKVIVKPIDTAKNLSSARFWGGALIGMGIFFSLTGFGIFVGLPLIIIGVIMLIFGGKKK